METYNGPERNFGYVMSAKKVKKQLLQAISDAPLKRQEINKRQHTIHEFMLSNSESLAEPNFQQISTADLGLLFHVTDEQFFNGQVGRACESLSGPLKFRLSRRMTTSGGMTTMRSGRVPDFEIAIATTPLFQTFQNERPSRVGGRICKSRLEALQRIMEHEMIHLAEMLIWNDSNCAARRFKGIAKSYFGHTESNHQLLTPRDVAKRKYQIRAGDYVAFQCEGRTMKGFVNRITKRATILVNDANGTMYTDGKRYAKYYVPIAQLKKVA